MKQICIYALIDPRTNEIRYVGKTDDLKTRIRRHNTEKGKDHRYYWIHQLHQCGLKPEVIILEVVTKENWQERERYWISFYRDQGARLVNIADGGNGAPGVKPSLETLFKMSESMKKSWIGRPRVKITEEHRKVFTMEGRKHTPETKLKMSVASKGVKKSPEAIEHIRKAKTGAKYGPISEEKREKLRVQKLGERNPMAKLTHEKAEEIRCKYAAGDISLSQLGREYGVDTKQIHRIVKGQAWT